MVLDDIVPQTNTFIQKDTDQLPSDEVIELIQIHVGNPVEDFDVFLRGTKTEK